VLNALLQAVRELAEPTAALPEMLHVETISVQDAPIEPFARSKVSMKAGMLAPAGGFRLVYQKSGEPSDSVMEPGRGRISANTSRASMRSNA
jgi:hypothetical protein